MIQAGLRIDVDTFRGTRDGVPRLLELLDEAGLKASLWGNTLVNAAIFQIRTEDE
ncbi:hypothetical protein HKT34_32205, partial [Pseudomonas aeruginosa]|nr:hypothetical protein [Pseudomonas aeruginosa]